MSSPLHEIDWQRGSERARLLVASDQWVIDGLLAMLPDARLTPVSDGTINALVAERGWLGLVSDIQLQQIDTFNLIDPEDQERWRVSSVTAGRPRAQIRVLPSFSAIGAAEHAMMLILALTRKLLPDYSAAVDGSWSRPCGEPKTVPTDARDHRSRTKRRGTRRTSHKLRNASALSRRRRER